jgi:hypothetical protein
MKNFGIITLLFLFSLNLSIQTDCPDGSTCPGYFTCCPNHKGFNCCPLKGAVCCEDGNHCCPGGYKCNLEKLRCEKQSENMSGDFSIDLVEVTPTSLIYRKGWNELYENCASDLAVIREDLIRLYKKVIDNPQKLGEAKEEFYNLLKDGKLASIDCIKFLEEVFG